MKFGDILKSAEDEGKEKHVPVIEVEGTDTVRIIVGKEIPHPNTVEHHIEWIELFGIKDNDQVISIGRTTFEPTFADPNVAFKVKTDEFKAFCALELLAETPRCRLADRVGQLGARVLVLAEGRFIVPIFVAGACVHERSVLTV